jgi:hypothetical protein
MSRVERHSQGAGGWSLCTEIKVVVLFSRDLAGSLFHHNDWLLSPAMERTHLAQEQATYPRELQRSTAEEVRAMSVVNRNSFSGQHELVDVTLMSSIVTRLENAVKINWSGAKKPLLSA